MGDKATILLVDDDPSILQYTADILENSGYRSLSARDGAEALELLGKIEPDIIVSDIMMPNMDGYSFYEKLRANLAWSTIPFIFLSAKGDRKDIRRGFQTGADFYLTKPFDPKDLLIAVDSRLKRTAEIQAAITEDVERIKQLLLDAFNHELRTPLFVIQGYLELLNDPQHPVGNDSLDNIHLTMQKSTERLVRLVEDLMLIAYLDSGAAKASLQRFWQSLSLRSIVTLLLKRLKSDLESNQITVELSCPDDIIVRGYPKYLDDLFIRLLDNAIKFGRSGGHVWIDVSSIDGEALVAVRDDGIGIAPEKQKDLFRRFQQIDRGTNEQQGVGIGLAIARRLVELHDGTIAVESHLGEGSTFTVHLPVDDVQEKE